MPRKMNFFIFFRALCLFLITFAPFHLNAYSIIFVHIGKSLPSHLSVSISQARLFNKDCPIYLIANQEAIYPLPVYLNKNNVTCISCESLTLSENHQNFRKCGNHDWGCRGLWVYSAERFFYLEEFIRTQNLHDAFHLENDIMLYVNLEELLPIFKKNYPGMIAVPFESDTRGGPGFMYISDPHPLTMMVQTFPSCIDESNVDMFLIARFKDKYHKTFIDHLPVIPTGYAQIHPFRAADAEFYSNHFDDFHSLFDASTLGIFLGGWDSVFHIESYPGAINYNSTFDAVYFSFVWKKDSKGRCIPFIEWNGKTIPINNLHISNKSQIKSFYSLYTETN